MLLTVNGGHRKLLWGLKCHMGTQDFKMEGFTGGGCRNFVQSEPSQGVWGRKSEDETKNAKVNC